jgi:hypothetical protein
MKENETPKWLELLRKTGFNLLESWQVCALFKITPRTLQNWRDDRKIKYSKPVRKTYYELEEVYRVLKDGEYSVDEGAISALQKKGAADEEKEI